MSEPLVNEKIEEFLGWTAETLAAPVENDDYGCRWPDGLDQYFKELHAYSVGGLQGHHAAWHLINAIKLDLPHVKMTNNGYINTTFLRLVYKYCEEPDLAIAGAASSGKTFPIAVCILEDWKASPSNTLSFVCTTSLGASEDRIWGAIVSLHGRSKYQCGTHIAHKYVIAWDNLSDEAADREYNSAIKAVAIPPGEEGKKAVDTLRGRKNKRVRLVFDELPEMGLYATNAAINLESNSGESELRVTYIGNPHKHDDAHGNVCRPDDPLGYKAINKHTPEWKTRTGCAIFMNGEWSPNFQAPPEEPIPFPYLTNRRVLEKMLKRCHGNRDSIEYYRNAIGFWPDASVSETVLTTDIIIAYEANLRKKWKGTERKRVAGLDVGFSRGGDSCVLQVGDVGVVTDNRRVLQHAKEYIIMPPATGVFEEEIAQQVVNICRAENIEPDNLGMDISSDGGKIYREIVRYWLSLGNKKAANVAAISSMGKPSERTISNVDPRKCSEVYDRQVTEFWMMIREGVMTKCICGIPFVPGEISELIEELCSRTYEIKGKKFSIETKDEMKERLRRSPDRADAFAYMVEMARRVGLVFLSPDDIERRTERRREQKEKQTKDEWSGYEEDDWGEDEAA